MNLNSLNIENITPVTSSDTKRPSWVDVSSFGIDYNGITRMFIWGPIFDTSDYKLLIHRLAIANSDETIEICINSIGGSIQTGLVICDAIKASKATVITRNIGIAASMGSGVLMSGDKIAIDDNTFTMFHMALMGGYDDVNRLNTKIQNIDNIVRQYLKKTVDIGILTEEEYKSIVDDSEELYFTADEMRKKLKTAGMLYEGGK